MGMIRRIRARLRIHLSLSVRLGISRIIGIRVSVCGSGHGCKYRRGYKYGHFFCKAIGISTRCVLDWIVT